MSGYDVFAYMDDENSSLIGRHKAIFTGAFFAIAALIGLVGDLSSNDDLLGLPGWAWAVWPLALFIFLCGCVVVKETNWARSNIFILKEHLDGLEIAPNVNPDPDPDPDVAARASRRVRVEEVLGGTPLEALQLLQEITNSGFRSLIFNKEPALKHRAGVILEDRGIVTRSHPAEDKVEFKIHEFYWQVLKAHHIEILEKAINASTAKASQGS